MHGGFFEELHVSAPPPRRDSSRSQKQETCEDCGLYRTCQSPKMQPSGRGDRGILVVAEAPGETEDRKGTQLVGKTGRYFREILSELDLDLDRDFWKTNALICRPPRNRAPSSKELRICRVNLLNTINAYKPKALLLVGEAAFDSYMGPRLVGRIKNVKYSDWVGEVIPDQELGMWVCPVYHPSYLVRQDDKVLEMQYRNQLRVLMSAVAGEFPWYESDPVEIARSPEEAIAWIEELLRVAPSWVAFDYETTGKKPHRKGHRIVSASFCDGRYTRAFSFTDEVREVWGRFLDSSIGKICHSMSFEEMWSLHFLRKGISGPRWDTLLAAHCLNNRKNVGLKFQVYSKFGVLGYDEDVDYYITTVRPGEDRKSDNSFNRIDEASESKRLRYNGEDSFWARRLFSVQKRELESNKRLLRGAQFFFESSRWLARAQHRGVRIDLAKLDSVEISIKRRMQCISERIRESSEVKRWDGKAPFNVGSPDQLAHLLFDILGVASVGSTEGGKRSVNEASLEQIDLPFVKDILEYRRWGKVRKTYLGQYKREVVDGFIHPFFGLGNVDTFRSSSNGPNLQNVPKRDDKVKDLVRSVIVPRPGNRLVEYDFKATEVMIAGCVFKDPAWLTYCRDPSKDMHRDTAIEILYLTPEHGLPWDSLEKSVAKKCRQASKNGWVFPSVYGSTGRNAAKGMWDQLPPEIKVHLAKRKNIQDVEDFADRMERYDREYWENRYSVYGAARRNLYRRYESKGYIEEVTGFRCYGPMSFTQVVNYPVQGPAFHVLLWTLGQVSREIQDWKKTFIVGEVHDSILADVHPDDEARLDALVLDYGTKRVREHWDWLIVPLTISKERSEVNGSWAQMSDAGELK